MRVERQNLIMPINLNKGWIKKESLMIERDHNHLAIKIKIKKMISKILIIKRISIKIKKLKLSDSEENKKY